MEAQADKLVQQVWAKFQDTPESKRLFVAVSGLPGSGKTQLAAKVTEQLKALYADEKPALASEITIAVFMPMNGDQTQPPSASTKADDENAQPKPHEAFPLPPSDFLGLLEQLREPICPETKTIRPPGADPDSEGSGASTMSFPKSSRIIIFEVNHLTRESSAPEWKEAVEAMDELWWFENIEGADTREREIKQEKASDIVSDKVEAAKKSNERESGNERIVLQVEA